jgi:hypothetical protein
MNTSQNLKVNWKNVPTRTITAGGVEFAYRELGTNNPGKVARVTYLDMVRGFLTRQDPKQFLFFTRTPAGIRAGKAFLARLKERSQNRDKEIIVTALQAQLKALRRWARRNRRICQRFTNLCLSHYRVTSRSTSRD